MKNEQIRHLIQKFFEGYTSLEEERFLERYLSDEQNNDEELRPLKAQFELMRKGKSFQFDSSLLESKILAKIGNYEKDQEPRVKKFQTSKLMVAASFAIIVTISGILVFRAQNNKLKDTYSDPQLAYLETQKTLLMISQKMNKGMEPLSNISKINTGSAQLKKLQKIDESMGMLNLVSFINQSSNMKK